MKSSTRILKNGSAPSATKQSLNPKAKTSPPTWLTLPRVALLKALASNQTQLNLSLRNLRELVRSFGVESAQDSDLWLLSELGLVADGGGDQWQITDAGRTALA